MFDRLFDVIFNSIQFFQFWEVVDQYEKGVVLRLGKFHRVVGPGFHFVIPFRVEKLIVDNVVPTTSNLGPQSLTTKDGKTVVVAAIVTHSITDIKKVLVQTEDVDNVITDCAYGTVGEVVMRSDWVEIRAEGFTDTLTKEVAKQARKWGVKIHRVRLSDASLSKSLRLWQV